MLNSHLMIDQGLATAVHNFGMKKSVTTKNQNHKLNTQNVQNLLKEAKRENLIDSQDFGKIQVGGDDLDQRQKRKFFNFSGTQNLQTQLKDFSLQQQRLNIQYGISPKNNTKQ